MRENFKATIEERWLTVIALAGFLCFVPVRQGIVVKPSKWLLPNRDGDRLAVVLTGMGGSVVYLKGRGLAKALPAKAKGKAKEKVL